MFKKLIQRFKEKTFDVRVDFQLEDGIETFIFKCFIPGDFLYSKFVLGRLRTATSSFQVEAEVETNHFALSAIKVGTVIKAAKFESDEPEEVSYKSIISILETDTLELSDDFDPEDYLHWRYTDRYKIANAIYDLLAPLPPEIVRSIVNAFSQAYREASDIDPITPTINAIKDLAEKASQERLAEAAAHEVERERELKAADEIQKRNEAEQEAVVEQAANKSDDPKRVLLEKKLTREAQAKRHAESFENN